MRALRLGSGGPRVVDDAPAPAIPPGEAVIRPIVAGVCATDIELCRGYMDFRGTLGHEFVGVVEAVGDPADRGWTGRRVVGGINAACGRCDMCRGGAPTHCRDRTVLGIEGRDGCFAERFALPVANLREVPDGVSDDAAVFAEPLAAAVQTRSDLDLRSGDRVAVLGDGRLGLLVARVIQLSLPEVELIGRHPDKLRHAERWGIRTRLATDIEPAADHDAVVECTGRPGGLGFAARMLRPRGTLILKTTVSPRSAERAGTPFDWSEVVIHELRVIGSRCGSLEAALELLVRGEVDPGPLIQRRFPLSDGVDALAAAARPGTLKILLTP